MPGGGAVSGRRAVFSTPLRRSNRAEKPRRSAKTVCVSAKRRTMRCVSPHVSPQVVEKFCPLVWEMGKRMWACAGVACLLCRLPTTPLACFPAPYSPDPLPRWGRGRFKVISCKGLRPLHPRGAEPGRRWDEASPAPGGACPRRCRLTLPLWYSQGGLIFLVACRPCLLLSFLPPSPEGKDRPSGRGARTCAVGKSARTGVCVAGRTCNNRHPLLTIAAEYGTITHRKNPKRGGKR